MKLETDRVYRIKATVSLAYGGRLVRIAALIGGGDVGVGWFLDAPSAQTERWFYASELEPASAIDLLAALAPREPSQRRPPSCEENRAAQSVTEHLVRQRYQSPSAIERLAAVTDAAARERVRVYDDRVRELEEFFRLTLPGS